MYFYKKQILLLSFCLFPFILFAESKPKEENRIALKANSLVLLKIFNPSIEVKLLDKFSFQLEAMGILQGEGFLGSDRPLSLGAGWVELRYYPKRVFKGFFFGGNAGWAAYRMNKGLHPTYTGVYKDKYQVGQNYMVGASAGFQYFINKHWGLELSAGGGYQSSRYEGFEKDGTQYVGWNGSGEILIYKVGLHIIFAY